MFLEVSFVHEVFTSLNCFTLLYSQCSATDDLLLRFARARPSVRHTVGRVVRSPGYGSQISRIFQELPYFGTYLPSPGQKPKSPVFDEA